MKQNGRPTLNEGMTQLIYTSPGRSHNDQQTRTYIWVHLAKVVHDTVEIELSCASHNVFPWLLNLGNNNNFIGPLNMEIITLLVHKTRK